MIFPSRKFSIPWGVILLLSSLMVSMWVVDAPAYVECEDLGVCEFLEVVCLADNHKEIFIENLDHPGINPAFVNRYVNPHREHESTGSPLQRDRHGLVDQSHISPLYTNHLSAKTLLFTIISILRS